MKFKKEPVCWLFSMYLLCSLDGKCIEFWDQSTTTAKIFCLVWWHKIYDGSFSNWKDCSLSGQGTGTDQILRHHLVTAKEGLLFTLSVLCRSTNVFHNKKKTVPHSDIKQKGSLKTLDLDTADNSNGIWQIFLHHLQAHFKGDILDLIKFWDKLHKNRSRAT